MENLHRRLSIAAKTGETLELALGELQTAFDASFPLLPRQEQIAIAARLKWIEQARSDQIPPQKTDWTTCFWAAGRGWGKRLCLKTPLATPTGWTTIGAIKVGDKLFDAEGNPCAVVVVHPIVNESNSWKVVFSDGAEIDACGEHLWHTIKHTERKSILRNGHQILPFWHLSHGLVRDTEEIRKTINFGKRHDTNHCIPVAQPLNLPSKELPIDPWLLGYWIANGSASCGEVTVGSHKGNMDGEWIEANISQRTKLKTTRKSYPAKGQSRIGITGLLGCLKKIGLIKNKHIPYDYLRASVQQRLDLLRGLCDGDGYIEASKTEFSTSNKHLAKQVVNLIQSLGEKCAYFETRAQLKGKDHGPHWRIYWRPSLFNPFSLPRKAGRFVIPNKQKSRLRHRMIVSVDKIPPKPMRCITVDSPGGLFLAGTNLIPTHNTRTGAEETWWQAYDNPNWRIGIIAPTHTDLRRTCLEGESGFLACCPRELIESYNRSLSEIVLTNGSRIFGYSSDVPERLRGPQHHFMWYEELAAWLYPQATWDMAQFGLRLGQRPRQIITSTPKPIEIIRNIIQDKKTVTIHSSTYANRANLPQSFFDEITKYEGTDLGRQEIYGEVLDLSSTAVFKRDWWRWWPHDKALPSFDLIIQSYDTAFSEKQTADDTACTTWGLFKAEEGRNHYSALLLDCLDDKISFPDLRLLAIKEFSTKYGTNDKMADGILVENKASGISLIQELRRADIPVYGYDPGGADKLQRAHLVSHLAKDGFVWVPQTKRRTANPQPTDWAKKWYEQMSYFGPDTLEDGSKKDYVDSTTQFLAFMSKTGWMRSSGMPAKEGYWKKQMKRTIYG